MGGSKSNIHNPPLGLNKKTSVLIFRYIPKNPTDAWGYSLTTCRGILCGSIPEISSDGTIQPWRKWPSQLMFRLGYGENIIWVGAPRLGGDGGCSFSGCRPVVLRYEFCYVSAIRSRHSPPCTPIPPCCSLHCHRRHNPADCTFPPPPLLPCDQEYSPFLLSAARPQPCCILKAVGLLR